MCQKTIEFYLYIQVPNVTSKNVSWPHFSWPTLYVLRIVYYLSVSIRHFRKTEIKTVDCRICLS